jgi:mono/diheme cytochrome c family protein
VVKRHLIFVSIFAAAGLVTSCRCSSSPGTSSVGGAADPKAQLIQRGKTVYAGNCMACHNMNPKLSGSVGPEVFGSSRELLEARLVKGGYPEGYKPKRPGEGMPLFPHLAGEIDALHAFLNAQ